MIGRYSQLCPVVFGPGAVAQTADVCKELGGTKALVITEKNLVTLGLVAKVEDSLKNGGIEYVIYDGAEMDAPDYTVKAAGDMGREMGADVIIGFGGGSAMDTAKVASVYMGSDITMDVVMSPEVQFRPQVNTILIPTTSGTGSEETFVGVSTNTETHYKTGVFAKPAFAIVDPELTLGLPAGITMYTGMDAMSHANEALCSANVPNLNSDVLAYDVFDRVYHWLPVAVAEPDNLEARINLAFASNSGGRAFNDSTVHLGHSMAHALGANYHIPHGYACAWVTPVIIEFMAGECIEKYKKVAKIIECELTGDESTYPAQIADHIRAFMRKLGLPTPESMGLTVEKMEACVDYLKVEPMTIFGLRKPTEEEMRELLVRVFEGYR